MKEDKIHTEGISTESSRIAKWFENYWYHYKWHTIAIAFAVIVILICTVQACSREEEDITMVYAGRAGVEMSADEAEALKKVLEAQMPSDFDGNGEKNITLVRYSILSEEQIKEYEASTDSEGNPIRVNRSFYSSEKANYHSFLGKGESSVLLLEPWLYEELRDSNALLPLSEVLASVPENAVDSCGIRLGDTEWYQTYSAAQVLPEDTVICLLQPLVIGKSSKPILYQREKEMFASLAETALLTQ